MRRTICAVIIILCGASAASAQMGRGWVIGKATSGVQTALCTDGSTPQQRISACTAILRSGQLHSENRPAVLYMLGAAYFESGDYDTAISVFSKAIEKEPNLEDALYGRGLSFEEKGQYGLAAQDFSAAISVKPDDSRPLGSRCWIRAATGQDLFLAIGDCDAAVRLSPKDESVLDSRCFVYFRLGSYANAIDDCTSALAIDPKHESSLYIRGLARLKTGDVAGGNADIAAAEAIDAKVADTYAGYGVKP